MSSHELTLHAAEEQKNEDKALFGFWVYIMTDCVLFGTLFAVYAVLHGNTFGGPSGADLFKLPYIMIETLLLLTSSYTCGLAMLAARRGDKRATISWFVLTFLLGAAFLTMELVEFTKLAHEGHSWQASGFLSSYFTLVGTHGLHITVGLLWMFLLVVKLWRQGFVGSTVKKLSMLSMFWHFLDIIWIFIFTFVYLFGALKV